MRICAWRHVGVAAAKTSVKRLTRKDISKEVALQLCHQPSLPTVHSNEMYRATQKKAKSDPECAPNVEIMQHRPEVSLCRNWEALRTYSPLQALEHMILM